MQKVKRNQKIPVSKLDNISQRLGELSKKEKSQLNLRESIYYLRHKLKRALKQGYSYEDLAQILAEQNITISATTLKQYLSDTVKRPTSKKQQINSLTSTDLTTQSDSSPEATQYNTSKAKKVKQVDIKKPTSTTKTVAVSSDTRQAIVENMSAQSNSSKSKSAVLSGLDQDLSHEFNQY